MLLQQSQTQGVYHQVSQRLALGQASGLQINSEWAVAAIGWQHIS
jgi:hypothetical protein